MILDSIGGEKVVSSGTALWGGQGAVRDVAPDLETTFVPHAGSSGGQVCASSNLGSLDVGVPVGINAPLAE